jgi:8-oxo-dGTP pyrophosphatase MutT (NUDIX family)
MVDSSDLSIVETCLREMDEELGIGARQTHILGVLRCNWSEVSNLTGISVTPVVGFIGDIENLTLTPNIEVGIFFQIHSLTLLFR